ncbi:hypothetical protein HAX54_031854 [Datura stramonium]|uniref:Uncharacterized protein n=1 Tax=Datura stramonium TaxID=4076 RepID=A0ABS8SC61_DATST|nr:hypothetical protein [Datura stramonium]
MFKCNKNMYISFNSFLRLIPSSNKQIASKHNVKNSTKQIERYQSAKSQSNLPELRPEREDIRPDSDQIRGNLISGVFSTSPSAQLHKISGAIEVQNSGGNIYSAGVGAPADLTVGDLCQLERQSLALPYNQVALHSSQPNTSNLNLKDEQSRVISGDGGVTVHDQEITNWLGNYMGNHSLKSEMQEAPFNLRLAVANGSLRA